MQLPVLACALQRALTERANIHFDYANISSKHVGANVYAMMSRNNCIPTCHKYLAKVTRRSFPPKPEVEWLARETSTACGQNETEVGHTDTDIVTMIHDNVTDISCP